MMALIYWQVRIPTLDLYLGSEFLVYQFPHQLMCCALSMGNFLCERTLDHGIFELYVTLHLVQGIPSQSVLHSLQGKLAENINSFSTPTPTPALLIQCSGNFHVSCSLQTLSSSWEVKEVPVAHTCSVKESFGGECSHCPSQSVRLLLGVDHLLCLRVDHYGLSSYFLRPV